MKLLNSKTLFILTLCMIVLTVLSTGIGLFYFNSGTPFEVANQYGDIVRMSGQGIYAHDSYFKAHISKGTDFIFLFAVVPILIAALVYDSRKATPKSRLLLTSVIGCVLYYSASYALGLSYNSLFLIYVSLFSVSFFGFIIGVVQLNQSESLIVDVSIIPHRASTVFLVISGFALFVAWLPDVIVAFINNRSISLIEVYTTEITYVLDMAIISPAIFVTMALLKRRHQLGYILLSVFLILCTIIGVTVCSQTIFQLQAGIVLSIGEIITKVAIFIALSLFSAVLELRLIKSV